MTIITSTEARPPPPKAFTEQQQQEPSVIDLANISSEEEYNDEGLFYCIAQ